MINDSQAFDVDHYTQSFTLEKGAAAAQVMVMGPDDHIVSVMRYVLVYIVETGPSLSLELIEITSKLRPNSFYLLLYVSSLNKPFGSGIVTPSGILLNSQILDFSWPNKTKNSSPNPVIKLAFV